MVPGIVILIDQVLSLFGPIILLLIFHFTIKKEENALLMKFGEKYEKYMKKVKRLVPGIY
ncbi:MAG: methyltransferase family protein [Promethearchaeota archaeon]